jgi:hypothetical protein
VSPPSPKRRAEREQRRDEKVTSKRKISIKTIGVILEALAIPIMIINIALLRMPNTDIGTSTILIIVSNFMFFSGLILSLPSKTEKKEK